MFEDVHILLYIGRATWLKQGSHPTNAKRRNHFSINVHVFHFCFHKNRKKHLTPCVPFVFPPEGNFDIDAGDWGGGNLGL